MARRLMKSALAAALHWSGAARPRADLPLILGYHRVVADFDASARTAIPSLLVSTATLERHIDWLARRYEFVSLDDAAHVVEQGGGKRPSAVLTFDDGYRDVYENAFPLLQRKGIPCAVFVVTGPTGTGELLLHDELYLLVSRCFGLWRAPGRDLARALDACGADAEVAARIARDAHCPYSATRAVLTQLDAGRIRRLVDHLREGARIPAAETEGMALMDWSMVVEMRRAGHVIGSHTCSHAYLTQETTDGVEAELHQSRYELQRRLGEEVAHVAYPNGDFNGAIADAAERVGYRYGYTVCGCRDARRPLMTIPRRMAWERSGFGARGFSTSVFACETGGYFDRWTGCSRAHAT